ncbi:hypothetical protein ABT297_38470 [Dactylosporangium sp. NPDC000555]|uniref:hypothetical protein n=1 Tax=Dactylosporangium sp. NPDC000555 TaxID=3154260 RepID=UPI0033257F9C
MPDVFLADRAGPFWDGRALADLRPGRRREDVHEMRIANGRRTVAPAVEGLPNLTLRLDGVSFLRVTTVNTNARMGSE